MHAAICFLLAYFNVLGVEMFLTRVDSIIRYLISEILFQYSGFRDLWQPCFSPFTVVFVACNGQLKDIPIPFDRLQELQPKSAQLRATWHCLLKNRLVKLEPNTLNDRNLQRISLVSKIQLVVYHQCCVLIGWATSRLCYSPLVAKSARHIWNVLAVKKDSSSFNLRKMFSLDIFWPTSWILLKQLFPSPS